MFENPILRFFAALYEFTVKIGSNAQSLFILWMRVTWGHQFYLSGIEKLEQIGKTIEFFITLHIPYPQFLAHAVVWVQCVGGWLLIVGLGSRLASIPLMAIMITALVTAHAEKIAQFRFLLEPTSLALLSPYPFLITSILVFVYGPGRISLDALIKRWADRQPKF